MKGNNTKLSNQPVFIPPNTEELMRPTLRGVPAVLFQNFSDVSIKQPLNKQHQNQHSSTNKCNSINKYNNSVNIKSKKNVADLSSSSKDGGEVQTAPSKTKPEFVPQRSVSGLISKFNTKPTTNNQQSVQSHHKNQNQNETSSEAQKSSIKVCI